ncbi:MAG: hypothetical protein M0Z44_00255 [Gammaproteobacteria bacterium]|nr:hypothetical protein [Gammaproteobacteria bacterium]
MMAQQLMPAYRWFWPGKSPLPDALWVVATSAAAAQARDFLEALQARTPVGLLLLDDAPYAGPVPWLRMPRLGAVRIVRRLQPRRLVMLEDDPRARALAAACPERAVWINGASSDLLALGRVFVASTLQETQIGGGELMGDPLVAPIPAVTAPTTDFCARFGAVQAAGRWILYFAATTEGEEPLAYGAFLQIAAMSGGLLALAPADPARHEGIYREAIKYHLLTTRQRRLMTSEVPPKTRVYYIEDAPARQSMYDCADLIVVGGTFCGGAVDMGAALAAARPLVIGPHRQDPLVRAAVRARLVATCESEADLAGQCRSLLGDADARAQYAQAIRAWLREQPTARQRVLDALTD